MTTAIRIIFQICLVLMILGALNWGLFALQPDNDLIKSIFGTSAIATICYSMICIAGIAGSFIWLSYPNDVCS